MSENTKPNNERPADLAVQDSVGGMARRLLNPAHLRDLAGRSVKTLREQGAEQLWRAVKFRVGLAAPRRHSAAPGAEGPARRAPAGAEDQHHRAAVQHASQAV